MVKKAKKTAEKTLPKLAGKEPKIESGGIKRTKIRVVGIGGGGGAIVSELASKVPKASFGAANTDLQALKTVNRKVLRFQFGQNLTRGLGTGMNPDLGREAAQGEKERIKKLLEGQDLCILVACLGGGTGSGAAPIFAKLSKNLGNLTFGIFTLPFKFEGEKKMEIARESLKKIKNHLNAITIIPNERVFQIIEKDTPLKQSLAVVNKILSDGLGGLIDTIYEPGLINIDFADFRTVLDGKGRFAYLNTVEAPRKEGTVKDLITKVLSCPLFPYSIKGGKGVLFNISGEKSLSLSEVNQISKTISELVNPEAKIIFGISQGPQHSDAIKIDLLVTGCGLKIFPSKPKKKKRKKKTGKTKKTKRSKTLKIKIPPEKTFLKPKVKKIKRKRKTKPKKTKARRVKKTKIKLSKKLKTRLTKESPGLPVEQLGREAGPDSSGEKSEERVRKNGLQIKKEAEELEKEMIEKEKFWEKPAFLRKKFIKEN
jgi:cell division protein FtsZ